MTSGSRMAVLVLGMHRSGTSAITGAVVRLGLTPPKRMLPPAADNPTGFYEATAVAVINQLLLGEAGCTWHDCLHFDPEAIDAAARQRVLVSTRRILAEDFGDAAEFVIKDPRLCMTLPAWLPALRAAGVGVAALLAARHPEEVAASLAARDRLPDATSVLHWLHYTLAAERDSRGLPRAVVRYDDLLHDPVVCLDRAARDAGVRWPLPREAVRTELDADLSRELRHHRAAPGSGCPGPATVRGLVADTWSALCELRDAPASPQALRTFDEVRTAFSAWRRSALEGIRTPDAGVPPRAANER